MRRYFISLYFLSLGSGAFSSDTNDFETIKNLLKTSADPYYQTNNSTKIDFDDNMAFAINDLLFGAFFSGRHKIITAHKNLEPFFVVIGATLRDCVLPGKHIYLQPSKPARKKLCKAYDNVFAHSIEEFCNAINTSSIRIPMFYANNVFNAMSLSELKINFSLIFKALKPHGTLLITADLAPEKSNLVTMLTKEYPDFWPIPLLEKSQNLYHKKSKMVLVPKDKIPSIKINLDLYKLLLSQPDELVENPVIIFAKENAQKLQIIDVEKFYSDTLIALLTDAGFVASYKNEMYFAECERIAEFQHPLFLQEADLQDFSVQFLSDDYSTFRNFNGDSQLAAFGQAISEPQLVDFPAINENYISKLRRNKKSLCGAQIHTIIAQKPEGH